MDGRRELSLKQLHVRCTPEHRLVVYTSHKWVVFQFDRQIVCSSPSSGYVLERIPCPSMSTCQDRVPKWYALLLSYFVYLLCDDFVVLLQDLIASVYASKEKYDRHCVAQRLPSQTLSRHLDDFLVHRCCVVLLIH